MPDLRDMVKLLREEIEQKEKEANDIVKEGAKKMLRSLVDKTPVDTGKAISNWIVTIGGSVTLDIPAHDPGKWGSTENSNTEIAYAEGATTIDLLRPGEELNISNNAVGNIGNYVPMLNDGRIPFRIKPNPQTRPYTGFIEEAKKILEDHIAQNT